MIRRSLSRHVSHVPYSRVCSTCTWQLSRSRSPKVDHVLCEHFIRMTWLDDVIYDAVMQYILDVGRSIRNIYGYWGKS